MQALEGLNRFLSGVTRLAVLGVGSDLRSDDAAGMIAARFLERRRRRNPRVLVVHGGPAPENVTGPIVDFAPSHLVVIDCADMSLRPGSVALVPVDRIDGLSAATHSLPLRLVADYLIKRLSCRAAIIGIQPGSLCFDGRLSRPVLRAARGVARDIARIACKMKHGPSADEPR
jgi:hydrogenase 3 maturation protease